MDPFSPFLYSHISLTTELLYVWQAAHFLARLLVGGRDGGVLACGCYGGVFVCVCDGGVFAVFCDDGALSLGGEGWFMGKGVQVSEIMSFEGDLTRQ